MIESFVVSVALIFIDVLSGIAAAAKKKEIKSSKMREGMFNKLGEVMLLALAVFVNFILTVHPFNEMGIPPEVAYTVVAYIAVMEIMSILENICIVNPSLPVSKILHIFNIDGKVETD